VRPAPASDSVDTGVIFRGSNGRDVNLTTHLRPVPKLRKLYINIRTACASVSLDGKP
jgi:hypothetical protein